MILSLKKETYDKVSQEGFLFHQTVQQNGLASELRIVVRDAGSANVGTVTVPFRELSK